MKILRYLLGVAVLSYSATAMPWWINNSSNRSFDDNSRMGNKRDSSSYFQHNKGRHQQINQHRGRFSAQNQHQNRRMAMGNRNNGNRGMNSRQGSRGRNGMNQGGMGNMGSAWQTTHFASYKLCARCHNNLKDKSGQDVSMPKDWRSTMMANSAVDPLWQAKVHSEILRNPSFKGVIEKKCSTCHMPMAKTQAQFDNQKIEIFGNGFLNKNNKYHKLAMEGVSCSLCHQIKPDNLGSESSFSGGYLVDEITKKPYRKIYGPFKNPFERPMIRMAKYQPVYSSHIKKSELCATCHTLKTPTVYENNVVGHFPEQTPYLEWKHSDYSKNGLTCQKCHMPEANGGVKISRMPRFLPEREPFAKHYFIGGNVFMLSIIRDNAKSLGVQATTDEFNKTIKRTLDMLKNKTAELHIGAVSIKNGVLEFPVIVENKTGHKFPSGIPIRRAWLHVVVKDKTGKVIFESGAVKPNGEIIGSDADREIYNYEPHYDVITSPEQVQIYEAVMKDYNGNITYTLLNAYEYAKDNRLLPEGFDKSSAPSDIAVKGNAKNDENFIGGSDAVLYKIDTKGAKGPFTITVELRYQSISYPFFKDLVKDAGKSTYVRKFQSLYNTKANTGIVIDSKQITY